MGVPYFFLELLCMQICTLCLCRRGRDPNLRTRLDTFTTPPLPPGTPPMPPLNANTHAGVLPALALLNSMRLRNANVDNVINGGIIPMLPEMDTFGDGEILGEGGISDHTKSAPLFPTGLYMTSLPAEVDGTAEALFQKAPRGGPYFPHCCHQQDVHIIVISIVINIFFLVLTT
jgi:hypothetical protein